MRNRDRRQPEQGRLALPTADDSENTATRPSEIGDENGRGAAVCTFATPPSWILKISGDAAATSSYDHTSPQRTARTSVENPSPWLSDGPDTRQQERHKAHRDSSASRIACGTRAYSPGRCGRRLHAREVPGMLRATPPSSRPSCSFISLAGKHEGNIPTNATADAHVASSDQSSRRSHPPTITGPHGIDMSIVAAILFCDQRRILDVGNQTGVSYHRNRLLARTTFERNA